MTLAISENEPLSRHTIFRIGGPARFFAETGDWEQTRVAIDFARSKNLPWFILGAGSNVLVSDRGFDGVVIHWIGGTVEIDGTNVVAEAPVSMARVVVESEKAGLRGFEWAIGVPGTVGGSVRGNAGCFGREMKDVVESLRVWDGDAGQEGLWKASEAEFGYRTSRFKSTSQIVIVSARLNLEAGDRREIEKTVREYTRRRTASQDIGSSSAGCIFKNIPWNRRDIDEPKTRELLPGMPETGTVLGIPAGYLVDLAGLKGYRIGGAKVSDRHGNFILNTGNASAEEVVMLVSLVKERVHRQFGILLEEEIQYVGF